MHVILLDCLRCSQMQTGRQAANSNRQIVYFVECSCCILAISQTGVKKFEKIDGVPIIVSATRLISNSKNVSVVVA